MFTKVFKLLPHNTYQLLYIQTLTGSSLKTKCRFKSYEMVLPFPIKKLLTYYLEQHNKSYSQQVKVGKRLLAINKLVPIYISNNVILFPIKQQRAPLQLYINAVAIIGLCSDLEGTIVTFENNVQLKVNESYTLLYKKWQESTLLLHLMHKSTHLS